MYSVCNTNEYIDYRRKVRKEYINKSRIAIFVLR